MTKIKEEFGSLVFNESVMQAKLPKDVFKKLKATMKEGKSLDVNVANSVANAMKDWALEHGATHYTHWFQPMTGITAEKHDSFIMPDGNDGILLEFSGKELIKGEPDASSFPNGGLRATFEARGYTTWDPTSYAFIKDRTLCIPTAFCSYDGSSLDKKTPLLRSMQAINDQALRILKLFGHNDVMRVTTTVGPEQEYFLIDRKLYEQRKDLKLCGRTLFGSLPPKGQELEDHYFGMLDKKVSDFMLELDEELWKLGVLAKTEHKEVAPRQFELAPVYTSSNIATDHNQLTMELMKKTAEKHGFVCLLHEKPFDGINGSGKHNNWSMSTNTGVNLLEPGDSPAENAQFLLILAALIKGVDEYQDLLRISVATASNDHRLGANEAPPAILSIYLGDELNSILEAIEKGVPYNQTFNKVMEIGVDILPSFPKDTTDRNRTSPLAFTGNKFEFRMLGSALSIACPNLIMNTIVAEELQQFADILENAEDFNKTLNDLIRKTIKDHKRILFSGNGYTDEWVKEAEERGLLNLKTTVDALPYYTSDKNIALFTKHKIFTVDEMYSRKEILQDNYNKVLHIEVLTMLEMTKKQILPAVLNTQKQLSDIILAKKAACAELTCEQEITQLKKMDQLTKDMVTAMNDLEREKNVAEKLQPYEQGIHYSTIILKKMEELRKAADTLETMTPKENWPFPDYTDLLFTE